LFVWFNFVFVSFSLLVHSSVPAIFSLYFFSAFRFTSSHPLTFSLMVHSGKPSILESPQIIHGSSSSSSSALAVLPYPSPSFYSSFASEDHRLSGTSVHAKRAAPESQARGETAEDEAEEEEGEDTQKGSAAQKSAAKRHKPKCLCCANVQRGRQSDVRERPSAVWSCHNPFSGSRSALAFPVPLEHIIFYFLLRFFGRNIFYWKSVNAAQRSTLRGNRIACCRLVNSSISFFKSKLVNNETTCILDQRI
jgi:hypothetical protein